MEFISNCFFCLHMNVCVLEYCRHRQCFKTNIEYILLYTNSILSRVFCFSWSFVSFCFPCNIYLNNFHVSICIYHVKTLVVLFFRFHSIYALFSQWIERERESIWCAISNFKIQQHREEKKETDEIGLKSTATTHTQCT